MQSKPLKILVLCTFWANLVLAQQPSGWKKNAFPISQRLYEAAEIAERQPDNLQAYLIEQQLVVGKGGQLLVEVINQDGSETIDLAHLRQCGLKVERHWKNFADALVAPAKIMEAASALRSGYRMRHVMQTVAFEDNEGPGVMNSSTYNISGNGGQGITIGLIDGGFDGFRSMPCSAVPCGARLIDTINLTSGSDFSLGANSSHGIGCVETLFDHAPNANYVLVKVLATASSWNITVDTMIALGVDVISCSVSPENTGWDDDSGYPCAAARTAAEEGILFFCSAGNEAQNHWSGSFNDPDDNFFHNFSGNDELADKVINNNRWIQVWLQWDSEPTEDFYDLYLYRLNTSSNTYVPVIASANSNDFEALSFFNSTGSAQTYAVRVGYVSTQSPPPFQLFTKGSGGDLQFAIAAGSTGSPANTDHPFVLSVGAVDFNDYGLHNDSTVIMDYSSQGPSHGGMLAPDLCGPTNTTTVSYGGAFTGTSCATPNVAGAVAAFWSKHPSLGAEGVRQIITAKARAYRDWGTFGHDNVYGRGGLFLHSYDADNRYIYENSGNANGSNTLPYTSLQQADQYAPANKNLIFLGQSHDAPPQGMVIDKPMLLKSAGREVNSEIE